MERNKISLKFNFLDLFIILFFVVMRKKNVTINLKKNCTAGYTLEQRLRHIM